MNTSSLFLRSKGKSRDYTWLKADHTCGEPPQYAEILEILDGESPSIVILQSDSNYEPSQLILFISNSPSSHRRDFQGRVIRDSIFWVQENTLENDNFFRKVTACILQKPEALQPIFDEVIEFPIPEENEDSIGFDFNPEMLKDKLLRLEPSFSASLSTVNCSQSKRIKSSESARKQLAEELLNREKLPQGYKFLVVVTGNKSEANLEKFKIWRSISKLVKSDEWEEVPNPEGTSSKKYAAIVILVISVLTVAIAVFLLVANHYCQEQDPQLTIETLACPDVPPSNCTVQHPQQTIETQCQALPKWMRFSSN